MNKYLLIFKDFEENLVISKQNHINLFIKHYLLFIHRLSFLVQITQLARLKGKKTHFLLWQMMYKKYTREPLSMDARFLFLFVS